MACLATGCAVCGACSSVVVVGGRAGKADMMAASKCGRVTTAGGADVGAVGCCTLGRVVVETTGCGRNDFGMGGDWKGDCS